MAFIFLIIGVSVIQPLADSTVDATEAKPITNESIALVNGTGTAAANSQWDSFTQLSNNSRILVEDTDFTVNLGLGVVTLNTLDNTISDGNYDLSYVYRNVGNSTARTLIILVILFFALAVLLGVIAILVPSFKDMMMAGLGRK